jgi:hypothetical protein
MAQTIEVHYWDDPAHAKGDWVPAEVAVTITVEVTALDPASPAAACLPRVVAVDLDLTQASLGDLLGDKVLGPWLELGHTPAHPARPAGIRQGAHPEARTRMDELRRFADLLDRSEEYISPSWSPEMGSRNKYSYKKSIKDDYAQWVADGRPPPREWQARRRGAAA